MTLQSVIPFPRHRSIPEQVSFNRRELNQIMSLYGRMVAAGEWRDYRISCRQDSSVFAVFRGAAESPLYRIEKRPDHCAGRQLYSVSGMNGEFLKGGAELDSVLRILDCKPVRSID